MYLRLNSGNRRLNDLFRAYGIINPYPWNAPFKRPWEQEDNKGWPKTINEMINNQSIPPPSIPANLIELDDSYIVQVDLPGYNEDSIRIDMDVNNDNTLTIEAERSIDEELRYITKERLSNKISKFIVIPSQVNLENCMAEYKDGVLTITLPKDQNDRSRRIQLKKLPPAE